jgi:excinuclease ABC subunit C
MACKNAANYLMSAIPKPTDPLPALERLQRRLELESFPHRLECVDISNFRGQFPVGSLVVFKDGEPNKSAYRWYRIRDVFQIDDPAMMAEVIRRRFTDVGESKGLPDLLVVDGGKAQLNQTLAILEDLDLQGRVPVVALAKKQRTAKGVESAEGDRLYLAGRKTPLLLKNDPPLQFLLGRLRDEAHRFAIEYYQKRHRKSTLRSRLDDIPGIGPKRRRALIQHFGSLNQLAQATAEEISQVPGVSNKLAKEIFSALKK